MVGARPVGSAAVGGVAVAEVRPILRGLPDHANTRGRGSMTELRPELIMIAQYGENGQAGADGSAAFWSLRPSLTHIRDFAYARMCSPWAVLGSTILHVLHYVPPWVTLPPLIGGRGSFNLFVANVGPTGAAKGAAERVAEEAFDLNELPVYT